MRQLIVLALLLGFVGGCNSSTTQNTTQPPATPPATSQAATQQQTTPPPPPPESFTAAEKKPDKTSTRPSSEPVSPTPGPGMTIEKADVGSGEKGRGYGQGIITTPVATYFKAQERIMFSIQIPDYIRAYKFEHDFKGPKSNEEFMNKIIKKNNIDLPALPPGHRYIYDPKTEELMVERPQ